ncbi:hypothetical protein Rumeso_03543 [Rubellimicrobium mesophilum DSM 19309]|uniref:2,4-dihydroxyhept-2-ene-1,7-dioic acid aldolase n=1 Tax=Rubellimicrobium mesophilum DSM 19309 TaxID=442562 RepID=A0A017HK74_9RHOB|nr:DUF2218 domain-containing protein [Rubellimicrobium mesophilum]EYD74902.1 hypothetical protein Rumeso_03543 [Rubellimicrobium mesophilum DSM 19309]
MTRITGTYETPNASRYLQQLCKHFGHKVEASFDETSGTIAFPAATATLAATSSALSVALDVQDPGQVARMREVIDSHLKRFAFREEFEGMAWQDA